MKALLIWGFPKIRVLFGGPHNKEYNILESIFGPDCLWKLPFDASLEQAT